MTLGNCSPSLRSGSGEAAIAEHVDVLTRALVDEEPLMREHAAWPLDRLSDRHVCRSAATSGCGVLTLNRGSRFTLPSMRDAVEEGTMRIGELAAMAGVPTATVRYYERRGLVTEATRTDAGYRQYGPEAARRLRFIKHAQELGFSLEEVQQMLALRVDDPAACARIETTTREKIRSVRQRLTKLQRLERTLQGLVRACEQHAPSEPCPILAVLADEPDDASVAGASAPRPTPALHRARARAGADA